MEIRGLPTLYPVPPRNDPAVRNPAAGENTAEDRGVQRSEGRDRSADHQLDYRQALRGARRSQRTDVEKEEGGFREVFEDRTPPRAQRALSAYAENAGSEVPENLVGVDTYA